MNTVIDLKKVSYTDFWWEDQEGNKSKRKPKLPTLHGREFDPQDRLHPRPGETTGPLLIDAARSRNALGIWQPKIKLQFNGTHALQFSGERALSLREAYNAQQFGVARAR